MDFPIDGARLQFTVARPAQQATDFDSGAVKIDKASGRPVWHVWLVAMDGQSSQQIKIRLLDQVAARQGDRVNVDSLVMSTMTGRDGTAVTWWSAAAVQVTAPDGGAWGPPTGSGEAAAPAAGARKASAGKAASA